MALSEFTEVKVTLEVNCEGHVEIAGRSRSLDTVKVRVWVVWNA